MNSGVYEIVNTVNGKRYVGSAKDFAKRWSVHRSRLKAGSHHNRHLQSSWNKHGPSLFEFRKLLICAPEHLLHYEQIAIDAIQPELNVERVAGNSLGCIRTPETRAKIAAKAAGRVCPPRSAEHREKLSAAMKRRPVSPHTMDALQAGRAARGEYTQEQREAIGAGLRRAYESGARSREKSELHRHRIAAAVSKLTAPEVREIRRLRVEGVTGRALAKRFCVPPSSITQICKRLTYQWVTDEPDQDQPASAGFPLLEPA